MSEEDRILRHNPRPAMICNAIMKAELLDVKSKNQNRKYALGAHSLYTKLDRVSIFRELMKAYSPNIKVATTEELWDGSLSNFKFNFVASGLYSLAKRPSSDTATTYCSIVVTKLNLLYNKLVNAAKMNGYQDIDITKILDSSTGDSRTVQAISFVCNYFSTLDVKSLNEDAWTTHLNKAASFFLDRSKKGSAAVHNSMH